MAKTPFRKSPGKIAVSVALTALLGYGAAHLTLSTITASEGYVSEAYQDPVGIWTKCWGDTNDVSPGATYSFEQCVESLNTRILAHAEPVMRCVPTLGERHDKVRAAFVSMAYNIGVGAFCSSSVAGHANAGEWERACTRISQIYRTAKGRELPGLVARRELESRMCLEGLREEGML